MRPLLASPEKEKIRIFTTKTIQHPLDRGLGGVGQCFSVEGARAACAIQLRSRLSPGQLPPSSTPSLLIDQDIYGLRHYLHLAWKLMKASVEDFTAFMEASMKDTEPMEASMEASMWKQLKRWKLP